MCFFQVNSHEEIIVDHFIERRLSYVNGVKWHLSKLELLYLLWYLRPLVESSERQKDVLKLKVNGVP